MKKNFLKFIGAVIIFFLVVPPIINFWVTTPSPIGFIDNDKQDVWIGFYAALIGGGMTLLGVAWTIRYTEKNRKEDLLKREQELRVEFENREQEAKRTLAIQYKPILTVSYDANLPAEAKYENFYTKNILRLTQRRNESKDDEKRIVISLDLLNIGRGEARNLVIKSTVYTQERLNWYTEECNYEELYMSNKLNLWIYKELTEIEWDYYCNNYLDKPVIITIEVCYEDLVGWQHVLRSKVIIHKFVSFASMKEDGGDISTNVLVMNADDSVIENATSVSYT